MEYQKEYPIENLIEWDKNPRKNEKAVEKLVPLIKKYGFINPIVIDQKGIIRAGHTRLKSAKKIGMKTVPVLIVNFESEMDAIGYAIADNKSVEYAKWDNDLLKEEINILKGLNFDLNLTGLGESEINRLLVEEEKITNQGNKEGKYEIKVGDLYRLGENRIICGDSTKKEIIDKLIGNNQVACVFTDPPYGVSYSGVNNPNGREWDIIEGDNLRGDELYDLIFKVFSNIEPTLKERAAIYVFHASRNQIIFEKALNDAGFKVKQQLIWHKHHILGHSHYHWCHEPMFYCSRIKEDPVFYGDRIDKTTLNKLDIETMSEQEVRDFLKKIQEGSTVWNFKKDGSKDYIHPNQKPIGIAKRAIINSSKPGEIILEPFAGSGSTLIACEKIKRRCFAVEYDPNFLSLIIERWENETGKKAEKIE